MYLDVDVGLDVRANEIGDDIAMSPQQGEVQTRLT